MRILMVEDEKRLAEPLAVLFPGIKILLIPASMAEAG